MTLDELRKNIAESSHAEYFQDLDVSFNFSYIDYRRDITGLSAIYDYVSVQSEGWNNIDVELPSDLKNSVAYFGDVKGRLDAFIRSFVISPNSLQIPQLNSGWNNVIQAIRKTNGLPLPFDHPRCQFLISIAQKHPKSMTGAHHYITNRISGNSMNRDYLTGAFLAYEFDSKPLSEITRRKSAEKRSLSQLRGQYQRRLQESESAFVNHLASYNKSYDDRSNEIVSFKDDKEKIFNDWFNGSQTSQKKLFTSSQQRIKELEKIYEEKLRLSKPADYWKERAIKLNKEGWYATTSMICLIALAAISLFILMVCTPDAVIQSLSLGAAATIKWSIIYLMFISLLIYGIRVTHRVAFSSFHLARDAEEREQLTYVYLAMIKDNEVSQEERNLIIQSLFSRADTGLLKDESSPTMPNDLIGITKIFGSK